jgi:hypothetical protein
MTNRARHRLPFVIAWILGIASLAWAGTLVDGYQLHVRSLPLPHPYPTRGVLMLAGIATAEILLLYAIIRPSSYSLSWKRALLALLFGIVLLSSFGATLMHAPPYVFTHWLWLAVVTISIIVFLCATLVGLLRKHAA